MKRMARKLSFVLIITVLLVSCKTKFDHPDKQIFHYNESSGILSLDPAFASGQATIWPCNQLYNGLVDMDENLQVVPAIAKSWTISEDGKTYTFILRNDVQFHNTDFFHSRNRDMSQLRISSIVWGAYSVRRWPRLARGFSRR